MNVFAKIFAQIFDSSISADHMVRHVFMDLLVLADRDGVVDMTIDAISRRTNVPEEAVTRAIEELTKPDRKSRSHAADGRRLMLIDSHRDWGWQIINYEHYRNIKDEEARRTYFRDKQREHRAKTTPHLSSPVKDNTTLSKEITQGEGEEDIFTPSGPDSFDGTELSVASAMLSELSIPSGPAILQQLSQALAFEEKRLGSAQKAIDSLQAAMGKAQKVSKPKWYLWLQDQMYLPETGEQNNGRTGKSKSGVVKQRLDGTLVALGEALAKRGVDGPWNTPSADSEEIPGTGECGDDRRVSGGLRATGPEILPPESQ